jgi:glycosyltransferase involved in cell wall biosynthesis
VRLLTLIKGLGAGGAEHLLVSAARLRRRDVFEEEIAYLVGNERTVIPDLAAIGVPTMSLEARHPQDPRLLADLRRLIEHGRYDIVHVHSPYVAGIVRLVLRTIPRNRRPKLVSTEHSLWTSHGRLSRALNSATFSFGDSWLAVSEDVRSTIPRVLRDRVEVLVHGVELDNAEALLSHRNEVRAELGIEADEIAIVSIANYRRLKGHEDLFRAACRLREHGVRARFLLIGWGELEAELVARHEELQLAGYVDLLGYRPDAMQVAAGCDIFALASHYEGLPVAIMEALAVGLPIVATNVGGVPEAVREGIEGLIVPPHRPDLLADAIESLVDDPRRRRQMGRAARQRAHDYDIEAAVRRTEELYLDVCSRPR